MAQRYGQPPSHWLLPASARETPEGLLRALDFDQTVMLVAVDDERREIERHRHNREVLDQNNERRRALGLPLDTLPG